MRRSTPHGSQGIVLRVLRWFTGAFRMAKGKGNASQTFDMVLVETEERIEDLKRRQQTVLKEMRDTVASRKGIDEAKKRIDEI